MLSLADYYRCQRNHFMQLRRGTGTVVFLSARVTLSLVSFQTLAQDITAESFLLPLDIFLLMLLGLCLVVLWAVYVWHRHRQQRSDLMHALSQLTVAVRQIDLFGEARPTLGFQTQGATGEVAEAINDLLVRLDRYRNRLLARDQRMRRLLDR